MVNVNTSLIDAVGLDRERIDGYARKKTHEIMRVSLDEISSTGHIVLADGCSGHRFEEEGSPGFCWAIYDSDGDTGVSRKLIEDEARSLEDITNIFAHENVYTIPEVVDEIRGKLRIVGAKCERFNTSLRHMPQRKRMRFEAAKNSRDRLASLHEKVYSLVETARSKDIRWLRDLNVPKHKFDAILDMIKIIDLEIGLKKDSGLLYGTTERDRSHDSDTDEKLVAYAYCLSMFSDKKAVVLSRDTDVINLMSITPRLMGSNSFMPANEFFRKRLTENPILLCFNDNKTPGDYSLVIDGAMGYGFDNYFKLYNRSLKRNNDVAGEIARLWREFNRS